MKTMQELSRRTGLLWILVLLSGCTTPTATPGESSSSSAGNPNKERTVAFEVTELSNANVDISPDGKTLLLDVLGHVYTAPVKGGVATQLTHGSAWNIRPRYSPDGKRIALVSDRGGKFEFWVGTADGSGLKEYPGLYAEEFGPAWGPDGSLMAVNGDPQSSFELANSARSPDGKYLYFGGLGLYRRERATGKITCLSESCFDLGKTKGGSRVQIDINAYPSEEYARPHLSNNGAILTYYVKTGKPTAVGVCKLQALDLASAQVTRFDGSARVCSSLAGVPNYALLPDGSAVIANDAGKLARFDVATGLRTVVPLKVPVVRPFVPPPLQARPDLSATADVKTKIIRWPKVTPDGSSLVFDAFAKVYVKDLKSGATRRLTKGGAFEYAPAISPDGRWVAYVTWSDATLGHVMVVPIEGGAPRQLTQVPGWYLNPVWSHDGRKLAFVSHQGARSREGVLALTSAGEGELWLQLIELTAAFEVRTVKKLAPLHWISRDGPMWITDLRFHPQPSFLPGDTRLVVSANLQAIDQRQDSAIGLVSFALDGGNPRPHARLLPSVDEATISPNGKYLAAVSRGKLHVLPLSMNGAGDKVADIAFTSANAVKGTDPMYVSWAGSGALVWAEGTQVLRYELQGKVLKLLSAVDVRLPRFKPSGCLAFVNARLLTLAEPKVMENATLQVCGDRIVGMGPTGKIALPSGTRIIDVLGSTIIPGIVDVHSHDHGHGESEIFPGQDTRYVALLAQGVTSIFDPQTEIMDAFGRSEMVAIGEEIGPRIYASGPGISGADHTDPALGLLDDGPVINNIADARAVVLSRSRYGAGPLKSYTENRRDRLKLLATAAREQGITVTSHPYHYDHAMAGVLDGISIEHSLAIGSNLEVHDDVLHLIAASGVSYTVDSIGAGHYEVNAADPKLNRLMPPPMLKYSDGNNPNPQFVRGREARSLARLAALGGLPTIGAHGNSVLGLSTHHDLWALVDDGGMSPYEALRVASLNGAKKIGMGTQLGSLEVGKLADLVVLNGNPLDDIHNTTDIRYVMRGGLVYDGPTMTRLWPDYRPLAPWPWQKDADRRRLAPSKPPSLPPAATH